MKRLYALSLLLLIGYQPVAHAHAVVTGYSLKMTPIHAHQADKVSLNFNSKIELGLSQVFLVSKGDQLTPLKIAQGDKQGQMMIAIPALAPGDYALKLKVFAADGHLTEDVIHFTVVP
ncbi:MAG: copper resistance protein CopC [Methylovulum sp.]|nr:copper resistance protein CopC [Methylovulum sp.]